MVTNGGKTYSTYQEMANKLNAKHWLNGSIFGNGTKCTVVSQGKHTYDDIDVLLVRSGVQEVLIGSEGVTLISSKKASRNMVGKKKEPERLTVRYGNVIKMFKTEPEANNWIRESVPFGGIADVYTIKKSHAIKVEKKLRKVK